MFGGFKTEQIRQEVASTSKADRTRVHEEVRILDEIRVAVAKGDVPEVVRLAEVLGWVHYGPSQ